MTTSRKLVIALLAGTCCLATGCQLDLDVASARRAIDDCPTWGCGANVGGLPIERLSLEGAINESGFRLVSFKSANGTSYELDVNDGEFRGLDAVGNPALVGDDVIGGVIELDRAGEPYYIHIQDRDAEMPYWGTRPGSATAYDLVFTDSYQSEGVHLCDTSLAGVDAIDWIGYETFALLIRGEQYDSETKEVTGWDDEWFHIACAGSALAKMVRLGYDPKTDTSDSYYTTPEQRQATLKMITADYCGTGRSFTRTGEPLAWANFANWHEVDENAMMSSEAWWTPRGAECLDVTRISANDDPDLLADVAAECGYTLDSCASAQEPPDLEWKTYNPDNAI